MFTLLNVFPFNSSMQHWRFDCFKEIDQYMTARPALALRSSGHKFWFVYFVLVYLWERSPRYRSDRRLDGPQGRSGHGGGKENPCPCRESILGYAARSESLYWLSYACIIKICQCFISHVKCEKETREISGSHGGNYVSWLSSGLLRRVLC
jgi:hypothetical protein